MQGVACEREALADQLLSCGSVRENDTLIVIQNDADHAQAKALIEKLMDSKDPADQARMVAQACLTEAYERSRWPRRAHST